MESHTGSIDPDDIAVPPSLTRPTRIRFRSRVRITSGLNRHRRSKNPSFPNPGSRTDTLQTANDDGGYFCYTPSSSISGSPSSSISAPLHSRTDDEADRPGWGPLGQRVSLLTKKSQMRKQSMSSEDHRPWLDHSHAQDLSASRGRPGPTEASPLLMSPSGVPGSGRCARGRPRKRSCYCSSCGSSRGALSPEEVDQTYGKWPSRILNYQWWWWQAEGVICCRCLDESGEEYY
ncbi:hypothetical protein AN958_04820 [Leucoagaricus sp. SymC.cos]|nr:hypothetical protein AN958_04820 [Leucoagaricus sp. SymC.cos]